MTDVIAMIVLAATWLFGALNPCGFPVRFLAVLGGIIALLLLPKSWLRRCVTRGNIREEH